MSDADKPYRNLRRFNAIMAVLHFVQGALMVYLSTDRKWEITETHLEFQQATETLIPVMDTWIERSPKRTSSSSRPRRR